MVAGLTTLFGFMIFFLILKKCNLVFFRLRSLVFIAAVSLGISYGMAVFVTEVLGNFFIILAVAAVVGILFFILKRGGGKDA